MLHVNAVFQYLLESSLRGVRFIDMQVLYTIDYPTVSVLRTD